MSDEGQKVEAKITEDSQWLTRSGTFPKMVSLPFKVRDLHHVMAKYIPAKGFWISDRIVIDRVEIDPTYIKEHWLRMLNEKKFTRLSLSDGPFMKYIWYRMDWEVFDAPSTTATPM